MARVVQRRTPPYLLIVFVILFIFATVMAVLFLNKFNTAEEQLVKLRETERQIISSTEARNADVAAMIREYQKPKPGGKILMSMCRAISD